MLEEFVVSVILGALVNSGILYAFLKMKIEQHLKINVCFFCFVFWLAMIEFFLASHLGYVGLHWAVSPFIGFGSGALGVYINK